MQTIAPELADLAASIADPGRAGILTRLMDVGAQTASELARVAGVTPQTASWHLARLVERALLKVERHGPRRLYGIATPLVAQMLEGMMTVAAIDPHPSRPQPRIDAQMRRARTCYDHLAGELGVAVTEAMLERGYLELDREAGELSAAGMAFLGGLGIDLPSQPRRRRVLCRPCLDWSERRPHLAGRAGAALAELAFQRDWIRRQPRGRSVEIT
ncbi:MULTISPECIES: winged helix-turn-helix domain-containing protein [unclassified Bradyrhizobium]|uniref:ArsR/SmtB family transcription factor n=1 Tax=unclassified Bradyrhizobium TaxID=2631580 RepID=UPI002479E159|nr:MULTISPECIES: winged helix-turn-helix domain-containing protein [unclassified Bradyrhizobium]WGS21879.1 winged helix-turn-helix domain-containing protein [Bradyrhizobium sp. ISRA463]WGS28833.1 winged helix-turn-helix domain-containing protein [Bradyrhizobium sp. ISRA464]